MDERMKKTNDAINFLLRKQAKEIFGVLDLCKINIPNSDRYEVCITGKKYERLKNIYTEND